MRVLVVNAGSSSLKLALLDERDQTLCARELPAARGAVDEQQLRGALDSALADADAVGHRVVHGGERFREPVLVDGRVRAELSALAELAPLHQPRSLAALDAVGRLLPALPAVACFDTAFHATMTPAAATYALPAAWRERFGLRRYGFHGLSHAWIARRAPELLGGAREPSIVSAHLGAGASLCAIRGGRSAETTMGFTPLEGLVMATRSGSVDPGMLLWLIAHRGLDAAELEDALEHRSGLLALGGSADMREILAGARGGRAEATLALDVYVHRLRAGIAAMAAAIGGLDALVFTGGVGERSAEIRSLAAAGLGFLGIAVAHDANRRAQPDTEVTAPGARARTLVIAAREDLEIARQVRSLLAPPGRP